MKSFDEWWEENYMMLSADRTEAEDIYNIGAQSRQAEIDELKNRIYTALNELDRLKYSSGERIYNDVSIILKGNQS